MSSARNSSTSRRDLIVRADVAGLAIGDEMSSAFELRRGRACLDPGLRDGHRLGSQSAPRRSAADSSPTALARTCKWTLTWRSPGGKSVSGRFNHAGDRVILGYDTGSAWVYDANANTPQIMLKDHYDAVRYAGFSSDDSAAVTVSRDGAVYIWDLQDFRHAALGDVQRPAGRLRGALARFPQTDGHHPRARACLLDIDTQQRRLWEFIPGSATVNSIAYSPDGTQIAVGCERQARLPAQLHQRACASIKRVPGP